MIETAETESRREGLRIFRQPAWAEAFPGLVQGITGRSEVRFGSDGDVGGDPGPAEGWTRLGRVTGIRRMVRCRQVHGADVAVCEGRPAEGLTVLGEADALVTRQEDALLVITVADCVPVFLVDPATRTLGLAHAGWRGAAAGVVGAALRRMRELGTEPGSVHAHLGPAVCGDCYEVGPEVPRALGGYAADATHVDLRGHLRGELLAAGLSAERVTVSPACTRCEPERYYSYRGGDRRRRMCAFCGWSPR